MHNCWWAAGKNPAPLGNCHHWEMSASSILPRELSQGQPVPTLLSLGDIAASLLRWVILQLEPTKSWAAVPQRMASSREGHSHVLPGQRDYNFLNQMSPMWSTERTTTILIAAANCGWHPGTPSTWASKNEVMRRCPMKQTTLDVLEAKVFKDAALHSWIPSYRASSPAPKIIHKHCCIPEAYGINHLITDIYPTSQSHKYPISTGLAKQQILNSDQYPWDKIAQPSKSTPRKSLKAHVKTSNFRALKKLTYKCQKGNE